MTAISTAKEYTPKLQKRTLKGHKKAVLCLAHSSERLSYYNNNNNATTSSSPSTNQNPNLLLSGSEDGTARLLDLRTRKTSICMELPRINAVDRNEVVSVAFHPSINESHKVEGADGDDNINSWSINNNDCTVYASTSNKVYGYDLRHHSTAVSNPSSVIKHLRPHFDLTNNFQCTDEIRRPDRRF